MLNGVGRVSCVGSGDCSRGRKGEEEMAHVEETAGATGLVCRSGSAEAMVDWGEIGTVETGSGFGGMGAAYLPTLSLLTGMDDVIVARLREVEGGVRGVAARESTWSDRLAARLLSRSQFGLFLGNRNL